MNFFRFSNIYQGRLNKGDELIAVLTNHLKEKNIKSGLILGIGAVSSAKLGYFNADTKKYEEKLFNENMEIVSLSGNISIKDNAIFPHIHAVLSKRDFSVAGGHLFSPTIVYAFEYQIYEFTGEPLIRQFDEETGLYLWNE